MEIITPLLYLTLTISWIYILVFSIKEVIKKKLKAKSLFIILFTILIIDASRTIIENIYFGVRLASEYKLIPENIFVILSNPNYIFFPKLISTIATIAIIILIFKKWYPQKIKEKELFEEKYEKEKIEREKITILNESLDALVQEKTKEIKKLTQELKEKDLEKV